MIPLTPDLIEELDGETYFILKPYSSQFVKLFKHKVEKNDSLATSANYLNIVAERNKAAGLTNAEEAAGSAADELFQEAAEQKKKKKKMKKKHITLNLSEQRWRIFMPAWRTNCRRWWLRNPCRTRRPRLMVRLNSRRRCRWPWRHR